MLVTLEKRKYCINDFNSKPKKKNFYDLAQKHIISFKENDNSNLSLEVDKIVYDI